MNMTTFKEGGFSRLIKSIPSSGIDHAYGYFGASVLKSVTVNVK